MLAPTAVVNNKWITISSPIYTQREKENILNTNECKAPAVYLAHATASISAWAFLYSSSLFARADLRSITAGSSSNKDDNCLFCTFFKVLKHQKTLIQTSGKWKLLHAQHNGHTWLFNDSNWKLLCNLIIYFNNIKQTDQYSRKEASPHN